MAERRKRRGYPGVEIRPNGTVRIRLKRRGRWTWRTVDFPPTTAGIRSAARVRSEILDRERLGCLTWSDYFPDEESPPREATPLTFGDVAMDWLAHIATTRAPSTVTGYRKRIKGIWLPKIGHMPIASILPSDIDKAIKAHDWRSPKTHQNALTPARMVFSYALRDRVITASPMDAVDVPTYQRPAVEALTRDERDALLADLDEHEPGWSAYFRVAFGSGLRTSEMLALSWHSVDMASEMIHVHSARVEGVDRARTKTAHSRTVPLLPMAAEGLRRAQASRFAGGRVFIHPGTGAPIHDEQGPRRAWRRACERAGVRRLRAYATRHTFASLLLDDGVRIELVSRWLGHASVKMTMDHYRAVRDATDEDMALARSSQLSHS